MQKLHSNRPHTARHDRGADSICLFVHRVAAPILIASWVTLPARADSGAVVDASSSAAQPVTQLQPVTVTGARDEGLRATHATVGVLGDLPLIEAPYTVSVIDEHLLDIQQAERYTDYLKNVPGSNTGNVTIGFFSLRGFSVGTDGYLYDGLPGHAALSETYQIDSVEHIDVYKGPSAFLSGFGGSSSLGGTLNYVPKYAADEPLYRVEGDYGNRSLGSVATDLGRRFGADRQFGVRFNARLRDGTQAAEHYGWTSKSASLALDWRALPTLTLKANFEYADNSLPRLPPFFVLSPGLAVPKAPDVSRNVALGFDQFHPLGGSAYGRADWAFAPDWTLSAQYLHSETARKHLPEARIGFVTGDDGSATMFAGVDGSRGIDESGQVLLRGRVQTGPLLHRLTLGGTITSQEQYSSFVDGTGAFPTNLYAPVDSPAPPADHTPLALSSRIGGRSLLASDIIELGAQWSVLAALRYAHFEQDNFQPSAPGSADAVPAGGSVATKASPTGALMFKPLPGALLYASYAQGFEQGGTAPMGSLNQNQHLPPLVTEQYELGAKLDRGGVSYALALFHLEKPSEFTNGAGYYVQDGRERHRGIEASATGRVFSGLDVIAGASWIDPRALKTGDAATDGKQAVSVPHLTTNLFADYRVPLLSGVYVNAGVYHNGAQYLDSANSQRLKGWTRLDLGARYETLIAAHPVKLLINVENLSGQNYWIGQAGVLTLADPLTLKASLRVDL